MQQQLDQLTHQMSLVVKAVTALLPAAEEPVQPVQPAQPATPVAHGFTEKTYFVRIKPYNKQLGHVRTRQFFSELGRAIDGGTGKPGDIPNWVEVTAAVAAQLSKYRQDDNKPMSPRVLDIATAAEREYIDATESQLRGAQLGMLGMTPQQIMEATKRTGGVRARVGTAIAPAQQVPQREVPTMLQGAELHAGLPAMQPPMAAQPAMQPVVPAEAAGRMAALQGVPETVPPPPQAAPEGLPPLPPTAPPPPIKSNRGVSEDLTAEAARDDGAKAALEAASKYPTSNAALHAK
jgi:hypothetical protein